MAVTLAEVMWDVRAAIELYAQGWFPMDHPLEPVLPWYAPEERAVFALDPASRAAVRRRVRRSLARTRELELRMDGAFAAVLEACAAPRGPEDGQWMTPRLRSLYRALHAEGWAHSWELWRGEELAAGILGVSVGRAAMLESMFHRVPDSGNALLSRTLDLLGEAGVELCDIQLPTEHTLRLGASLIPRAEYEDRLGGALRS